MQKQSGTNRNRRTAAMTTLATADGPRKPHSWTRKFGFAFRGVKRGIRSEVSFFVHFFVAALVIAAGIVLEVSRIEWCVLVLCIGFVLVAELFNTSLEWLARAVTDEYNSFIHDALDMASGAVLLATMTSVTCGLIVFLHRIGVLFDWWPES